MREIARPSRTARDVHRQAAVRRLVPLFLILSACSAPAGDDAASSSEDLSATDPVSAAVTSSCSTSIVKGLSQQLVDEMDCLKPGTLQSIASIPNVDIGSAVFPYLQAPAASALSKAVAARGTTLTVNSALRTLPQQYLLYEWYLQGRCGIGLAAAPGNSNHESGLAVDVEDNTGWRSSFESHGWKWFGSADPVHFDYVAGGIDIRSLSVLAFQKLWNENHPSDTIAEDGSYGPDTEKRLVLSPVGGFAKGATCTQPKPDSGTPEKDAGSTDDAAPPPQAPDASATPDAGAPESPATGGCSTSSSAPDSSMFGVFLLALALATRGRRCERRAPLRSV